MASFFFKRPAVQVESSKRAAWRDVPRGMMCQESEDCHCGFEQCRQDHNPLQPASWPGVWHGEFMELFQILMMFATIMTSGCPAALSMSWA